MMIKGRPTTNCTIAYFFLAAFSCCGAEESNAPLREVLKDSGNITTPTQQSPATDVLRAATSSIQKRFDEWLEEPAKYRELALRECGAFPEGKIYPFALPAIAYSNMAVAGDIKKEHAAKQMRKLLDIAIPIVGDAIHAPQGDLQRLRTYRRQGTFLGTLNYTFGAYRIVSDDGRYDLLHSHLSKLLRTAIKERNGAPIDSYPIYTWNFDTIMALASLDLFDRANGISLTTPLLDAHFKWRKKHATLADSGLPRAFRDHTSRGCDLSLQVCLLGNLRPSVAHDLYQAYVKHHWLDHGFAAGFSEWPKEYKVPLVGDIDSGPVLFGIGSTASGVGIGAAKAVDDKKRLKRLTREFAAVSKLLHTLIASEKDNPMLSWFGENVRVDERYYTGFLYGDAALFYAITWTKLPDARKEKIVSSNSISEDKNKRASSQLKSSVQE